jgi:hypothetical protein
MQAHTITSTGARAKRENDAICYTNSKKKIIIITLGNSMKKKGAMQQEK